MGESPSTDGLLGSGSLVNRFETRPGRAIVALWLVGGALVMLGFEACYRFQVIDFYGADLRRANEAATLEPGSRAGRTLLFMGDSFTGWPTSYPSLLRERLGSGVRVINSGVSGFTLRQIVRVLPGRLTTFEPDTVVVQLFAGNDLVELRHPVAWSRLSPLRNLFWIASDSPLESVGFINYRLGSLQGLLLRRLRGAPEAADRAAPAGFTIERFSAHEKTLIAAEPDYVEAQLRVDARYQDAYARYLRLLGQALDLATPVARRVFVLVVPDPVQIHGRYVERLRLLGGAASSARAVEASSPFLDGVAAVVLSRPGVVLIDPLEALRREEKEGRPVVRDTDLHLNPGGQEVLADLVLRELHASPRR